MTHMKSRWLCGFFSVVVTFAISVTVAVVPANAEYPTKPVTLVAAFGPGGTSDVTTRVLAVNAAPYLGQPVAVVNKAGAGGVVGANFVHNAAPDGYTILLARVATHAVAPAVKNVPYKYDDFTFLGLIEKNPFVCVTSNERPYKSLADVIEAVKASPGKLSFGSPGVGTLPHLMGVMILDEAGVKDAGKAAVHVPFKGEGKAVLALLAGKIDYMCLNLAPAIGHIQAGRLRPLMTTMPERLSAIPDVPTARELGYPKLEVAVGWSAVVGPPNMAPEATKKWVEVLTKLKADKSWLSMTKKLGSIPVVLSPDETKQFVSTSFQTMNDLVTKLDMRIK